MRGAGRIVAILVIGNSQRRALSAALISLDGQKGLLEIKEGPG